MAVFHRVMNAPDRSALPLLEASIKGDVVKLDSLIENGSDVNDKDEYQWTALQLAAAYGHAEIVKSLLINL